jgi:hypothetical protein
MIRACIHQPEINGDEITKAVMDALPSYTMKTYGGLDSKTGTEGRFILLEFTTATWNDAEDIDTALRDFKPVLCGNSPCPGETKGCPAYSR